MSSVRSHARRRRPFARFRAVPAVVAATLVLPVAPARASASVVVPAARAGDAWSVDVLGDRYEMVVGQRATALDRWGRARDAFAVSVAGFHPVGFEGKEVTDHTMYVDAASGAQVADVAAYRFGGTDVTSEPAAYSSFEPNNPDGWPGWVQAGGALAGRTLVQGETVVVPFVMTSTRGADAIVLVVEEDAARNGVPCARARGATTFPSYTWYSTDGYRRGTVTVALDVTSCADAPYAARTRVSYSGAFSHSVEFTRSAFSAGTGEAIGIGPYAEPGRHVAGSFVPFDGRLRDGGPMDLPSLEAAQEAADLAPGLIAWRLAHADGYLVEATYLAAEAAGLLATDNAWRLVYAAPSGDRHGVIVREAAGRAIAVDQPLLGPYPAPVPARSGFPATVLSPAGAIAAWRALAGPARPVTGLRWQPLLDGRWYVTGKVSATCGGSPCGTLFMEMPFDAETGAAGTGEHPLPQPG